MRQMRPLVSKSVSTLPPQVSNARGSSRSPNPLRAGRVTIGQSLSRHSMLIILFDNDQLTDALPAGVESAPYFAALVASS